ncbi:MAG: acyltransferase [Pseudomonadota bacterium]
MLKRFPEMIKGGFSLILLMLNTLFWCVPLFLLALLKAMIPFKLLLPGYNRILNSIAEHWIWVNNLNQKLIGKIHWDIQGVESLQPSNWYLVLANHQSWADILVLQRIFHRKIPFLKFFIKKELFWFPFLGQAWWALDFPFIKRYSRDLLKKKPHLIGKDLEITRKACVKFKKLPVSIMNFVEGTRFSHTKQIRQQSPFTHLLKPKAGGIASVLEVMGDQIHRILDVTIFYSGNVRSFWAFLSGNIREIKVRVRSLPVGPELFGSYGNDVSFREQLQQWVTSLWNEKNKCIELLSKETSTASIVLNSK